MFAGSRSSGGLAPVLPPTSGSPDCSVHAPREHVFSVQWLFGLPRQADDSFCSQRSPSSLWGGTVTGSTCHTGWWVLWGPSARGQGPEEGTRTSVCAWAGHVQGTAHVWWLRVGAWEGRPESSIMAAFTTPWSSWETSAQGRGAATATTTTLSLLLLHLGAM